MRFYQEQHRFYCGVDLHARCMYLCILDQAGQVLVHQNYPADARAFLNAIAPYRDNLVVAVECMFAWYWLADLCAEHNIPFVGEVKTSIRESAQGTCVRHRIIGNLLKMYDKQDSVLRLETLLKNTLHFRVFRTPEGADANEPMRYMRLRQGVADMHRRAEVSQKINERYAASLATVEEARPLGQLVKGISQRTRVKGRSVRALNPLAKEDAALLEAVGRGEFLIHGFRNRDLRAILYGSGEKSEQRVQAGKITRLLGILRAHGLIAKVPRTHRYQLTEKGRTTISALLAARHANVKQLLQAAA